MIVAFYVEYPYYFPHFIPIGKVFKDKSNDVKYILSNNQNSDNMEFIAQENRLDYIFGEEALFNTNIDVIFFANPYKKVENIKALSIFLEHGIGTKSTSFFSSIEYFDIYLVEGTQKFNRLKELYPQYEDKLSIVGFSKLDEIFSFEEEKISTLFNKYKLDKRKKTILYAPTFFPSSIEKMADNFPEEFPECNIVVKPHYLTYERKQYSKQRQKLDKWKSYLNCTVLPLEEYNLVPWLAISDVMISDESSAMFEFAALNKPVISNQYFKLRWSYYFMPWKLKSRIDSSKNKYRNILDNAYSYEETIGYTQEALLNPNKKEKERLIVSEELCGKLDGKVSERIYATVQKNINKISELKKK